MTIRQAQNTKQDCDLVFSLSNDPLVRACSFNTKPIEYVQHCKWFAKTVSDVNTFFLLIFDNKSFVGQIRFKRESEQSTECVISLSITKEYRGKHIAGNFLQLGIEELKKNWYNIKTVVAEVKDENSASKALFLRKGFELISKVNTYKMDII
ncbi:MAG: GNAT family N-acetyltransferase [Spirochaetales bacterium]|nr:GNAT family N-acetyltransferase [Spirochaetales bacterium]